MTCIENPEAAWQLVEYVFERSADPWVLENLDQAGGAPGTSRCFYAGVASEHLSIHPGFKTVLGHVCTGSWLRDLAAMLAFLHGYGMTRHD